MNAVQDKWVLVTGASSGIGAETARVAAARSGKVILLARREDRLREVAGSILAQGGQAYCYPVDLSNPSQVEDVGQKIKSEVGIPDVIINNAGAGRWLTIEETSAAQAMEMLALPYLAAFSVTRAFLPEMKARGSGHIINLTSDASFLPKGAAIGYSAARYALRGFSEALRGYLLGTGVTVSLAVFGKVASTYWQNNPGSEERIPRAIPFMPTLTTRQVAEVLMEIIQNKTPVVVKPGIFKLLFWSFRHWPDPVARNMANPAST